MIKAFPVFASLVFAIVGMGICGSTAASQDPAQANTPPKPKAPKLLPDIMVQSPHISRRLRSDALDQKYAIGHNNEGRSDKAA